MKVFISHSSKNTELVNRVQRALRNVSVDPLFAEFEPDEFPPFRKIERMMRSSEAAFLLLTPEIKATEHTQNWVSYEVGLAQAFDKNLYVFEKRNRTQRFPVPYLTHYYLYDPSKSTEISVLEEAASEVEESRKVGSWFPGMIIGALLGAPFGRRGMLAGGTAGATIGKIADEGQASYTINVKCPHERCKIEFKLFAELFDGFTFNCPSCRQKMKIPLR